MNKLKTIDREAVSWKCLFKIQKITPLKQFGKHYLDRRFVHASEIGWAHGKIQHKIHLKLGHTFCNFSLAPKRKIYKTSMKHLKIHKFPFKNVIVLAIECKMYLKIQQELHCLGCISKQTMRSVLKKTWLNSWRTMSWWKASLPPQKESWAFFWTFSFHFLYLDGVFLTLKCKTLVLKHLHTDRAAAICCKWISVTKVSKYGKSEYSRALNARYTFQPLMGFWLECILFLSIKDSKPPRTPALGSDSLYYNKNTKTQDHKTVRGSGGMGKFVSALCLQSCFWNLLAYAINCVYTRGVVLLGLNLQNLSLSDCLLKILWLSAIL